MRRSPQRSASLRLPPDLDPHLLPLPFFFPKVSFVDPNFGLTGIASENDEHPPTDIQRGQAFVSQVVNAVRNSPNLA